MHPSIYSLTLFLDRETKIKIEDTIVTFPEGFYVYVQGHSDAHGRIDEHMGEKKGSDRVDLFLKKAHIVDTKVSRMTYGSGETMLKDLLKVRSKIVKDFKAQMTPVLGLYHVAGPHVVSKKFSRLFS